MHHLYVHPESERRSDHFHRMIERLKVIIDEIEDQRQDSGEPELNESLVALGLDEDALSYYCPGDVEIDLLTWKITMAYDAIPWFTPILQHAMADAGVNCIFVGEPYPDADMLPWESMRPYVVIGREGVEEVKPGELVSDPEALSQAMKKLLKNDLQADDRETGPAPR